MLQPRDCVRNVPAYVPGKPPGPASYKLSSNENPFPPLPGVIEASESILAAMNRYPDMGAQHLYQTLATKFGVATDQLALGTGSVALLYHLIQAYCEPGDEVVYAWRSFEAYPIAAAVSGAVSVQIPNRDDGSHDLAGLADAVTERTKLVLLCTPNNPTGTALTHTQVATFVEQLPGEALVVLDEAYREFVTGPDPLRAEELLANHPRVVIVRTFAKAYGLAGLRVGYLIGDPSVAAAVRACALPFGVSSVAQAAAVASLDAEPQLLARVSQIVAERERVTSALTSQGWNLPDDQGNFLWFPLGSRSLDFAAECDAAGIVVRPFAGEGVRVTIGEPAANNLLLDVASTWAAATPPS